MIKEPRINSIIIIKVLIKYLKKYKKIFFILLINNTNDFYHEDILFYFGFKRETKILTLLKIFFTK